MYYIIDSCVSSSSSLLLLLLLLFSLYFFLCLSLSSPIDPHSLTSQNVEQTDSLCVKSENKNKKLRDLRRVGVFLLMRLHVMP